MKITQGLLATIFSIGLFGTVGYNAVHLVEKEKLEDFNEFKQMPTYTGKVVETYDAHSGMKNNKITLEDTSTHERQSFYASDVTLLRNPKGNEAKFKYNPDTNLVEYDYRHQTFPKNADEYRELVN